MYHPDLLLWRATFSIDVPINQWVDEDTCRTIGKERRQVAILFAAENAEVCEGYIRGRYKLDSYNLGDVKVIRAEEALVVLSPIVSR